MDDQTTIITKTNRTNWQNKSIKSQNITLNQSTKIDFSSTDDSKILDQTTKTEQTRKISSFFLTGRTHRNNNI